MANPQKAWKAEYAKSARSSCKTCKSIIDKEILRLGKMVQAKQFDGVMPMWNHASCILKKANQIKFITDVEGIESLRWEDQQRIRKYVEEGGGNDDSSGPPGVEAAKDMEYGIELSQTSRAHCKGCSEKIMKGEVRVSTKPDGQGPRGLAWHHANCFMDLYPSVQVDKLSGWESLAAPDQAVVHSLVKKVPSTAKTGIKNEGKEDEKLQQSSSKAGAKRRKDTSGDQKSKVAKFKGDVPTSSAAFAKNDSELDSKLESQSKELWALKDDLKKHVTTVELRSMLEANSQISNGSELDLRDRCADGMIFGALGCCSMCSGSLHYSGGMYRCGGYLSEWSKCSYSTCEPARLKGKWKIPEETDNQYLIKWFKSQKRNKPVRILAPLSSDNLSGNPATSSQSQSSKSENLGDLKAVVSGLPKESLKEWKGKIEAAGGQLHAKIKKGSNDRTVNSEGV